MPVYVFVPLLVVALLAGFGVAYMLLRNRQGNGAIAIEAKATQTLSEAETQAKEKLLEAKEEAVKVRTAAEQEALEYRVQSQQIEKRLLQKEENLDRKGEDLNRRERELTGKEKGLDDIKAQLEDTYRQQERELQRVANMTRQEAQGILMGQVEQELRNEVARKVRESELVARDESDRRAQRPHHRQGGPQHQGPPAGDGDRSNRRRHPGSRDHQRFRPGPPRGRPSRAEQADRGRPDSSGSDRRDRRQVPTGGPAKGQRGGGGGGFGGRTPGPSP